MSELDTLQAAIGAWARATFPASDDDKVLRHLQREVVELIQGNDPSEAADCLILLLNWCSRRGVSLWDVTQAKWAVVQARQWGAPDSEGVIEHVRADPPWQDRQRDSPA